MGSRLMLWDHKIVYNPSKNGGDRSVKRNSACQARRANDRSGEPAPQVACKRVVAAGMMHT
jgi:hypothetical protein